MLVSKCSPLKSYEHFPSLSVVLIDIVLTTRRHSYISPEDTLIMISYIFPGLRVKEQRGMRDDWGIGRISTSFNGKCS